jgi:hypothetical protein
MVPSKPDTESKIIFSPEDDVIFNSSRLLLFFEVSRNIKPDQGTDLERVAYYDFFAANPFLIVGKDDPLRLELELEGFEPNKLEYISTPQRFRTKRASLKQYLSMLLSKGLISIENSDGKILYRITQRGMDVAGKISSLYAIAYRKSVAFVLKKLKDYSDKRLWEEASLWLEAKSFQVDLYDMVENSDE